MEIDEIVKKFEYWIEQEINNEESYQKLNFKQRKQTCKERSRIFWNIYNKIPKENKNLRHGFEFGYVYPEKYKKSQEENGERFKPLLKQIKDSFKD